MPQLFPPPPPAPLRPLEFLWTSDIDDAFTVMRQSLASAPTLWLRTDASRKGLGFVLQQKSLGLGPSWILLPFTSRKPLCYHHKLELLAVSWATGVDPVFLKGGGGGGGANGNAWCMAVAAGRVPLKLFTNDCD